MRLTLILATAVLVILPPYGLAALLRWRWAAGRLESLLLRAEEALDPEEDWR